MRNLLKKIIPHDDIGWKEIGETFTRFTLAKTPWFRIYLHYLDAPNWHPQCHDHPWSFVTFILKGGYWESNGTHVTWRGPGSILYRPAEFKHNVITIKPGWSLVITGAKRRQWGFVEDCR